MVLRRAPRIGEDELQVAALRIVLDRGLHALTPELLAAMAGQPVQVITGALPRFPQFVADTFQRVVGSELAEVKRALLMHPAPVDQLRAFVAMLADPVRDEVTAAWLEGFSLARHRPALAAVVRSEQQAWRRFTAGIVQRGIRSGDWATDQPQLVAMMLLALVDGLNGYALVDQETGADRRRLLESVVQHELGVRLAPVDRGAAEPTGARG